MWGCYGLIRKDGCLVDYSLTITFSRKTPLSGTARSQWWWRHRDPCRHPWNETDASVKRLSQQTWRRRWVSEEQHRAGWSRQSWCDCCAICRTCAWGCHRTGRRGGIRTELKHSSAPFCQYFPSRRCRTRGSSWSSRWCISTGPTTHNSRKYTAANYMLHDVSKSTTSYGMSAHVLLTWNSPKLMAPSPFESNIPIMSLHVSGLNGFHVPLERARCSSSALIWPDLQTRKSITHSLPATHRSLSTEEKICCKFGCWKAIVNLTLKTEIIGGCGLANKKIRRLIYKCAL